MKLTGFIALLPACFFVISLPVQAQQAWPEGIFCSCPPTTGIVQLYAMLGGRVLPGAGLYVIMCNAGGRRLHLKLFVQ